MRVVVGRPSAGGTLPPGMLDPIIETGLDLQHPVLQAEAELSLNQPAHSLKHPSPILFLFRINVGLHYGLYGACLQFQLHLLPVILAARGGVPRFNAGRHDSDGCDHRTRGRDALFAIHRQAQRLLIWQASQMVQEATGGPSETHLFLQMWPAVVRPNSPRLLSSPAQKLLHAGAGHVWLDCAWLSIVLVAPLYSVTGHCWLQTLLELLSR